MRARQLGSVLVGLAMSATTAGWAADGALDRTFNKTGKATLTFRAQADDMPAAVVIQTDGKIVAGGILQHLPDQFGDFALARFLPDGRLDRSFGVNGKVVTSFDASAAGGGADYLRDLVLQADKKIVAVGPTYGSFLSPSDFGVARYLPNGQLDPSFGNGGLARHDVGFLDDAQEVAMQPDGKIVIVGWAVGFDGMPEATLVRLLSDGQPDLTFGVGGHTTLRPEGLPADAFCLALQKDGKLVIGGFALLAGLDENQRQPFLARFLPNGNPDPAFSGDGVIILREPTPGGVAQVAVAADGKILAGGDRKRRLPRTDWDMAVWRLLPGGTLDRSFGQAGKQLVDFFGKNDDGGGIALTTKGKIVVGGHAAGFNGSPLQHMALARLNANGSFDNTFGAGGKQLTVLGPAGSGTGDLALQKDGKIVTVSGVGPESVPNAVDMVVTRHLAAP